MVEAERMDLDVLIIGGGGAGAMAAIWAAKEVNRVALVEKGVFGKSGCTPMGVYSMCAAFGYSDPADSPKLHMEDTIRQGRFINNQELVEIYTQEAPERVMELISYGAKFDTDENGRLKQGMMPGHSYPRACFFDRRTGPMIMGTLARKAKRTPQIRIFEEVFIIDLVVQEEGPHYAIGIRWADTTFIVFRAKAIVVTTGGGAQVYKHNTTSLDNTGDGLSLIFQAGAELADMEFVQFYPTAVCYPKLPGLSPTAPAFLRIRVGAKLYNVLGEEFAQKKMPGWRFQATRDLLAQAIYKEVIEGRGSPHGGVYLDVTHLPPEEVKKEAEFGNYYNRMLQIGVDITQRPIETTVSAHFFMGGARVNAQGETNVPGLFAGGEAAAGYHGANRLGGNALSEILVSGSRAGKFAGLWAKIIPEKKIGEKTLEKRLAAAQQRIAQWRERKTGLRPIEGKRMIQELMWEKAGVIREGHKMREGLSSLESLLEEGERNLMICPEKRYNRELLDTFEFLHMVQVSSCILRAGLVREESRGAHYREDFPFPDDGKWLVNILLTKSEGGVKVRTEEVKLTHLRPQR